MRDIKASGEYDPIGRIVVLEDLNGDGAMDRRTVFADGLIQPRAMKVLDQGVLVGEPPNVWLMRDIDGDLRSDRKELVTAGYGRRETNVEVNANALLWGLDNRIHMAGTGADMILRLVDRTFQVQKSLSRGQWGATQDDAGRVYRNHNESVLHVDLVSSPYYARNPALLRTRGSHEPLQDPGGNVNDVWPAHQTPGTNRAYQQGVLRTDGTLAAYSAACAPTVYRGDRLPADLYGNVFVAEPTANVVSRLMLSDDGRTLRARKAYGQTEFLTSTDERFRPVYLSNAPDGTLYVVDMYRGVIQHHTYITEYLRDQIASRALEQPIGLGRIYRVVHERTTRDRTTLGATPAASQLVSLLSRPNGWWRDTAQRLLVERGDRSVAAALVTLAHTAPEWRTRGQALWTLDGLNAIEPLTVDQGAGGCLARGPAECRPHRGALARRSRPSGAACGDRPGRRPGLGGPATSGGVAGRAPGRPSRAIARRRARASRPGSGDDRRGAERTSRPGAGGARGAAEQRRRTNPFPRGCGDDGGGDDRASRDRRVPSPICSPRSPTPTVQRGSARRCFAVPRLRSWVPRCRARPRRCGRQARPRHRVRPVPAAGPVRVAPMRFHARPTGRPPRGRSNAPALRLTREPAGLLAAAAGSDDLSARASALLARITWPGKTGDADAPRCVDAGATTAVRSRP